MCGRHLRHAILTEHYQILKENYYEEAENIFAIHPLYIGHRGCGRARRLWRRVDRGPHIRSHAQGRGGRCRVHAG